MELLKALNIFCPTIYCHFIQVESHIDDTMFFERCKTEMNYINLGTIMTITEVIRTQLDNVLFCSLNNESFWWNYDFLFGIDFQGSLQNQLKTLHIRIEVAW